MDWTEFPTPGGAWTEDVAAPGMKKPSGVFGEQPGATPKYATNVGAPDKDFRETMARMFIQVPNDDGFKRFVASVTQQDPNSEGLANVLAGTNIVTSKTGTGYIDFLLQNVQHQFQEKMQVTETLSDSYVVYFFGQGAPTFQYSGMLINTKQDDQANNMLRIYEYMIRGYQLAKRKQLLRLRYNDLIVAGAAYNFNFQLAAEGEMACPFSFSLLVKSIRPLQDPYSGIVVQNQSPFATQSVLAAAGFPDGTLPGSDTSGTGTVNLQQQQVTTMVTPELLATPEQLEFGSVAAALTNSVINLPNAVITMGIANISAQMIATPVTARKSLSTYDTANAGIKDAVDKVLGIFL